MKSVLTARQEAKTAVECMRYYRNTASMVAFVSIVILYLLKNTLYVLTEPFALCSYVQNCSQYSFHKILVSENVTFLFQLYCTLRYSIDIVTYQCIHGPWVTTLISTVRVQSQGGSC